MGKFKGETRFMIMQELIRHGDLMIVPCDQIPTEAKELNTSVLMHGESGNEHVLGRYAQIFESAGIKYVKASQDSTLVHEQHKEVPIAKGLYKINVEQEFDPIQEIVNKVRD